MTGCTTLANRFKAVMVLVAGLLLAALGPATAQSPLDVQRMILEEAAAAGVPAALALAVARVESNFNPKAESPVGAKGVMQIMPKTARDVFGVAEQKLWDARLNIRLGVQFLAQLYQQYGRRWELALSHYNGGTLRGGGGAFAIPHDYTRKYVADVLQWQRVYAADVLDPSRPAKRGDPRFLPVPVSADASERPWRIETGKAQPPSRARPVGSSADKPWRRDTRLDPLEYSDWADAQQRRIAARRDDGERGTHE